MLPQVRRRTCCSGLLPKSTLLAPHHLFIPTGLPRAEHQLLFIYLFIEQKREKLNHEERMKKPSLLSDLLSRKHYAGRLWPDISSKSSTMPIHIRKQLMRKSFIKAHRQRRFCSQSKVRNSDAFSLCVRSTRNVMRAGALSRKPDRILHPAGGWWKIRQEKSSTKFLIRGTNHVKAIGRLSVPVTLNVLTS